jgi:hypothetical protein
VLASLIVLVSTPARSVRAQDECQASTPQGWSVGDEATWNDLRGDGVADANGRCLTPTFLEDLLRGVPPTDALAGRSITIYRAVVAAPIDMEGVARDAGVRLVDATFHEQVRLIDSSFAGEVSFAGSRFRNGLDLSYSTFGRLNLIEAILTRANLNFIETGDLLAPRSRVEHVLSANGAVFRGNVDLIDGCFHAVSLISAEVRLDVAADGATFARGGGCWPRFRSNESTETCPPEGSPTDLPADVGLTLNAANVLGSVRLLISNPDRRRGCFGHVAINNAHIGNEVQVAAAHIRGDFRLNGSDVGTVYLWGSNFGDSAAVEDVPATFDGDVDLASATIAGNVVLGRADFCGEVTLRSIEVGGDVFVGDSNLEDHPARQMDDRARFDGSLDLESARFAGDIVLGLAEFPGDVSLFGSNVSGSLILDGSSDWTPPDRPDCADPYAVDDRPRQHDDERPPSRLILTGTTTIAVRDETPSGEGGADADVPTAWPLRLELEGFEYGGGAAESGFLDRSHEWHKQWLLRDPDIPDHIPRQPFTQLEKALRESGREGAADDIAILRRDLERDALAWADPERAAMEVWGRTLGYGYTPFRGLPWIAALVIAGWILAWWMPRALRDALGIGNPLVFSVARLVPFPRMGKAHDVDVSNTLIPISIRLYFFVHTVVGYLIPLYVVAVIGSLLAS